VVVRAPGRLTQRNLHADDCLVPVMPLLCFVVGADNGSLLVQDTLLGDASCTHIDQSAAADWLLKSACWATWRTSWQKVDERSVLIADTGEISGLPHGVRWRVANTTLRCTANETHPLPPGAAAPPAGAATHPSDMQLAAATSATLLATLALLYYALNRNGGRPGKRGRGLQLARGWSTGRGCCAQTPLLPPSHASPRLNLDSDSRLSHGAHPAPARPPSGVC
jgi:hypothetical protein